MSRTKSKKRRLYISLALLCIIAFTICLYFIQNPQSFKKLYSSLNGEFDTSRDFVKFMDVGQGDSALIYSNGYSAVIDMGLPTAANDIFEDLTECDIKELDAVLISHLHSDHIGSLEKVAENYKIKNLIMPEILNSSIGAAKNGKQIVTGYNSSFYRAEQGMHFKIGEFEITLLGYLNDKKNENNRSVFTMAEIDGIKFLFTGDAEIKAENYLLEENLNLDCDVLKVSHHGSNTSSGETFLKAVSPEYAVISVGEDNAYSHPHKETLASLKSTNAEIFRTDKQGDITFNIENGKISIQTEN